MISIWTIGINIVARSNFPLVAANIARSSAGAAGAVAGLNKEANNIGKGASAAESRWGSAFASIRTTGVAAFNALSIAAAAATVVGIKGAANLQDAIAQTAVAMGRSSASIDSMFTPLALQMSNRTAQSVTNSMELLRTMATSGLNDPAQLRSLAMPIALFADTQYLGKNHVDFNDSAAMAAKLAHQFGARTAGQMKPILNTLFKISQDMPDSLAQATTQLRYYAAAYTGAGVSSTEILQLQATLDRLGYGSARSGTGMQMALRYLRNPTKKMAAAQDALGISGYINPATGAFDVEGMLQHLASGYNASRKGRYAESFDRLVGSAFTSNAANIIGALIQPAGQAQRDAVRKTMLRVPDLEAAQAQLLDTLNNQTKRLYTNFESLSTILEKPFIGRLTTVVGDLADALGNLTNYFGNNPGQAKLAGGAMAALGTYGAYKVLSWGHLAAHAFTRVAGIGGIGISRYGLGGAEGAAAGALGAGGVVASLRGLLSMSATRSLPALVDDIGYLGIRSLGSKAGLELMLGAMARLGARAIPAAGEVLLFSDAMKLFKDHAQDAGNAVGTAARWITDVGAPNLATSIKDAFKEGIKAGFWGILAGIGDFINSHNPFITGGDAIISFANAARSSFHGLSSSHVSAAPLGLPNHASVITAPVGPGMGLYLPAPRGVGPLREKSRRVVNHFHYHAPTGGHDALHRRIAAQEHRKMKDHVAKHLAADMKTGAKAAGSTIASVGVSQYEIDGSYA